MHPVRWTELATPVDALGVAVDDIGVCAVRFGGVPVAAKDAPPAVLLVEAVGAFRRYFAGELVGFDLPLSVRGGSEFERAVWAALSAIPYGQTRTYGQVAASIGRPDAARAVGVACNRNPLPIVVPCHRVVGAGRKLVGFGGGLWRKKLLLELEARVSIELQLGQDGLF